ncbi:YggW family oxidoreductase [Eikenella longinqua]|uniref:Heme chaperone HemW n=1 Tax=Eikenella longinqua TaxID=1795827 RepID=A0A1A9S3M2_9NEIS|nr:radical SAM family heme chaperone HemW [Eikenella longinqua]OAM31237.1 YggW family oxidoreductase [Eikenella longinqua]
MPLLQAPALSAPPPLSLYIHIPWCIQKCPYCDFNSHRLKPDTSEAAYIDALLADLQHELPHIWGRPVETIFIGGGTPSVFSAESINRLLGGVRALVRLLPDAEITLEANPGTFEQARFQGYAEAGVNRLSLGIQSFNDAKLKALGRIHNGSEARAAIEAALAIFPRVNTDIMYALPRQTPAEARQDIQSAIDSGVSHISAYHLTMEPNTPFGRTPPPGIPEEDAAYDIEQAVHQALLAAGFAHYETSAFARANQQCRHNLNYWQFGDYIGIGAGAHGKISSHSGIIRTTRARHPRSYLAAMQDNPAEAIERFQVAPGELPFEFMLNAMRLTQGVPTHLFTERTGLSLAAIARPLQSAVRLGLIDPSPALLRPTERGQRYLNDLLQLFL